MTTRVWTGLAGDLNVYTPGNWTPAGEPAIGDILVQNAGVSEVPNGNLNSNPLFLSTPVSGTTPVTPAITNIGDGATVSVVVGPSAGDLTTSHAASITASGTAGLNLVSGPTQATNSTAVGLASGAVLTANIFLSGNNILNIGGDTTTALGTSQVNVGNGTIARIDTHTLGTDKYTVGFLGSMQINRAVDTGASVSLLANSGASLTLTDPLEFSGTVNFFNAAASGTTTTTPSVIGLVGVPADSYAFANNELTFFSAGHVTDTLNLLGTPGGFGVFKGASGVVVTSSNLGSTPPGLTVLPLHA